MPATDGEFPPHLARIWHGRVTDSLRLDRESGARGVVRAAKLPARDVTVRLAGVQVVCYLLSELRHRSTRTAFAF